MIIYRYRTLDALNEMVYVSMLGDHHVVTCVDDYKAKFSQFDMHHVALCRIAEDMAMFLTDMLTDVMNITRPLDACHMRDMIKPPNEVTLIRIDKPFRSNGEAVAHIANPMEEILADVDYPTFITTVTLY